MQLRLADLPTRCCQRPQKSKKEKKACQKAAKLCGDAQYGEIEFEGRGLFRDQFRVNWVKIVQ